MEYYNITAHAVAHKLKTDIKNGLDENDAKKRMLLYGKNELKEKKKASFLVRFFKQFNDFMIMILLGAAAVSFLTSILYGSADITEPLIILTIVTLNALLGTFQEMRAEHSLEELKRLSSPHTLVMRSGKEYKISSAEVVPGDILHLHAGDMICADCRLINCTELNVDESAMTGESHPVLKNADITYNEATAASDTKNMLYSSSHILSGTATAIVVRTGMDTEVGRIASLLMDSVPAETPLQKRLAEVGKTLGIAALFICGIVFGIGILKKLPPIDMFMTSVSLAVAAIPEGLPAIVTIMLALGLQRMAKHNAIIRNLPSVETLGCATVICTDKTGTITRNRMKVRDIRAGDDRLLLELSVLCSENGDFINPTDSAVAEAAKNRHLNIDELIKLHPKTLYIPFDSSRKRMSVHCGNRTIIKGALEYILPFLNKPSRRTEPSDLILKACTS